MWDQVKEYIGKKTAGLCKGVMSSMLDTRCAGRGIRYTVFGSCHRNGDQKYHDMKTEQRRCRLNRNNPNVLDIFIPNTKSKLMIHLAHEFQCSAAKRCSAIQFTTIYKLRVKGHQPKVVNRGRVPDPIQEFHLPQRPS